MPPTPRFVSGGQTGVDRAVLDACLAKGWPCGGWCPRGRLAEDGPIAARYPLAETGSPDYAVRTERNLTEADATVVVTDGAPTGGTLLSLELLRQHGRPHHVVDVATDPVEAATDIVTFIRYGDYGKVNWSGPRASKSARVYPWTRETVERVIDLLG